MAPREEVDLVLREIEIDVVVAHDIRAQQSHGRRLEKVVGQDGEAEIPAFHAADLERRHNRAFVDARAVYHPDFGAETQHLTIEAERVGLLIREHARGRARIDREWHLMIVQRDGYDDAVGVVGADIERGVAGEPAVRRTVVGNGGRCNEPKRQQRQARQARNRMIGHRKPPGMPRKENAGRVRQPTRGPTFHPETAMNLGINCNRALSGGLNPYMGSDGWRRHARVARDSLCRHSWQFSA